MAAHGSREAEERNASTGSLLWRAAQSIGKDVSETEVHQQTRQKEIGGETWPQRLSGKLKLSTNIFCIVPLWKSEVNWSRSYFAYSLLSGKNLVPKPKNEMAQFQRKRASVVRRLQGTNFADENEPQSWPERRWKKVRKWRGFKRKPARANQRSRVQRRFTFQVAFHFQQALRLLRIGGRGNNRVIIIKQTM